MSDSTARSHPYHLVEPSSWPLIGSLALFVLAIGAIGTMAANRGADIMPMPAAVTVLAVGVAGLIYTLIGWWRDVIREAEYDGHHTPAVQLHMRYGMVLFIASELMFFFAWFWAFFDVALAPAPTPQIERSTLTEGTWPPAGIETLNAWHIPLYNTLILLTSGATLTYAHHALRAGDRQGLKWGLIVTILLGVVFTALQAYEYRHATFGLDGHIYGATFYLATGFHGLHVIIGTIFLTVCAFRVASGHFRQDHHFGFEAAAWYWHFVDVVWIFLFVFLYALPQIAPTVATVGG